MPLIKRKVILPALQAKQLIFKNQKPAIKQASKNY